MSRDANTQDPAMDQAGAPLRPDQRAAPRIPAGVVLYHPDLAILTAQFQALARSGRSIFVFLNGEPEAAVHQLLAAHPSAHVLASRENIGLGAGLNAICGAARDAGFTHIMLLDQDSEPAAELPEALHAIWRDETARGTRVGCVAPLLVPPAGEGYRQIRYAWRGKPAGPLAPVDFAATSGSLISLEAFDAVGPFRADFFIAGIDVEWGFRAWANGFASLVARELPMPHRWGEPEDPASGDTPQFLRQGGARQFYHVRNSIHCLRLPHISVTYRLRSLAIMLAQITLFCVRGPDRRRGLRLIRAGLTAGLAGRLGPMPATLAR